jgi:hypothetical protein
MSQYRVGSEIGLVSKEYRAIITRYEGKATQCTIFPADTEQNKETTRWISAESPSFVALANCR